MLPEIRVLLLADTHLGIDLPARPRVVRRHRGLDFYACYERALAPALCGDVDLVVHGGDLFNHSRVSAGCVAEAFAPLHRIAERGVPVLLVPGNHERGRVPYPLLSSHPGVHVFDRPRVFRLRVGGMTLAAGGFPFTRDAGRRFGALCAETGLASERAAVRILCMHQAVEGARVGVDDFTFRPGNPEVVRGAELPAGVAAVLSGHIHRAQVLRRDLSGRALPAPVVYPGSVERTAFVERAEVKGFWRLSLAPGPPGGRLDRLRFEPLPARPMALLDLDLVEAAPEVVLEAIRGALLAQAPNAVVRLRLTARAGSAVAPLLTAARLRELTPPGMSVSLAHREPRAPHEPVDRATSAR